MRIAAKHENDPLREEIEEWVRKDKILGRKPTIFHLLMTRFREMKGAVEFERIEKEFRYTKEFMGLIKERGKVISEEFTNSKEEQEENIREFLTKCTDTCRDVLLFTDGSALNNPGPTGAGAVAYIDGYNSVPVLMKKGVTPIGNNYTGELVGIQIGLEFIADLEYVQNRSVHILTDCQPAIKTAFGGHLPSCKIETVISIHESMNKICGRGNEVKIHWAPGHKDIEGNELADQQAKTAAVEMSAPDVPILPVLDKREVITEIKKQMTNKWKLKYLSTEIGKRNCHGEEDRGTFAVMNQLLSGHTLLNSHRAKINSTVSDLCENQTCLHWKLRMCSQD